MSKLENLLNICLIPRSFFTNETITMNHLVIGRHEKKNNLFFMYMNDKPIEKSFKEISDRISYSKINQEIIEQIIMTKIVTSFIPAVFVFSEDKLTLIDDSIEVIRPKEIEINLAVDKNLVHKFMSDWLSFAIKQKKYTKDNLKKGTDLDRLLNRLINDLHQNNDLKQYTDSWKDLLSLMSK